MLMSTPSDSAPTSPDDFIRLLRERAKQAEAASGEHAGLSEQYLNLSQQFAELAGKASTASVSELQAALQKIETTTAEQNPGVNAVPLSSAVPGIFVIPSNVVTGPGITVNAVPGAFASPPGAPAALNSGAADKGSTKATKNAQETPAAKPDEKKRRLPTRKFVERVRNARLAANRRVKVKAKKADLKPQQRHALDELNRSRGSILTSVLCVATALFILSLITLHFEIEVPPAPIMASFADEIAEIEEPLPVEIPEEEQGEQQEQEVEEPVEEPEPEPEEEIAEEEPVEEPVEVAEETPEEADAPEAEVETSEIPSAEEGADSMALVDHRSAAGRRMMLEKFGGSAASESAVQRGLEWLASVQHPDGWWDFRNVGPSSNAGTMNNPIGGTAYALLPFLAAGQTHREGDYQKQMEAGLGYLTRIGLAAPAGYDLRGVRNKGDKDKEPNEAYYVHGAATLVLCEAYGMTKDRRLKKPAMSALQFMINSQDPIGGGWRYVPQQPGSTSVTAIQLMALMAAKKAGLKVPQKSLDGVMHYLDTVQVDGEGRYGYEVSKKTYRGSATAMALLGRMYLGWGRDDGDMRAGVALLDDAGPYENMYTTYFATQVMRNWGGEEWHRWNTRLRDDLIAFQETNGPEAGSWKPRSGMHTKQGGRLLETSLALLTLEVYYRYKPLLPEQAAAEGEGKLVLDAGE